MLGSELLLDDVQELLQSGHADNGVVALAAGRVQQQDHEVLHRRSSGQLRVDAKALLLSGERGFDPLAGETVEGASRLIRPLLQVVKGVVVELDVQLLRLGFIGRGAVDRRCRFAQSLDDPGAGERVVRQRLGRCDGLDARQEARGDAPR
ncbi:MAG: hypothetical protein ACREPA_05880 [Candidatus Dormibacteraceae bacterium]